MPRRLFTFLQKYLGLSERRCVRCQAPFFPENSESETSGATPDASRIPHTRTPAENTHLSRALCPDCRSALLPRTGGFCPRCGALFPLPQSPCTLCSACLTAPPPWDALYFYAEYDGALRELILRYKFGHDISLAPFLGKLLVYTWFLRQTEVQAPAQHSIQKIVQNSRQTSAHASAQCAEKLSGVTPHFATMQTPVPAPPLCLIPVPLHEKRLLQRGFNQSLELARPLERALAAPLLPHALVRLRATPPQSTLSRQERHSNLRGAFLADPALVSGKHCVVVDDVSTTGATSKECALALKKAGAARITVLLLARTAPTP